MIPSSGFRDSTCIISDCMSGLIHPLFLTSEVRIYPICINNSMNLLEEENDCPVVAKTCVATHAVDKRKVTYMFLNEYHGLCLDRKDLVLAQLEACEKLLRYAKDPVDKEAVDREIKELKMALDLMT